MIICTYLRTYEKRIGVFLLVLHTYLLLQFLPYANALVLLSSVIFTCLTKGVVCRYCLYVRYRPDATSHSRLTRECVTPAWNNCEWSSRVKCARKCSSRVVLACIFYSRVLLESGPRGCLSLACVYGFAPLL